MKKLTVTALAVLAIATFITGCGQSYKGTDSTVKRTALSCCRDIFRNQLTPVIYQKVTSVPIGLLGVKIKYEDLVKSKKLKDREVVKEINETMDKIEFRLTNIRTSSIDKDAQMSTNQADLVLFNLDKKEELEKKIPIIYTAQLNDEGNVYVSVQFLE